MDRFDDFSRKGFDFLNLSGRKRIDKGTQQTMQRFFLLRFHEENRLAGFPYKAKKARGGIGVKTQGKLVGQKTGGAQQVDKVFQAFDVYLHQSDFFRNIFFIPDFFRDTTEILIGKLWIVMKKGGLRLGFRKIDQDLPQDIMGQRKKHAGRLFAASFSNQRLPEARGNLKSFD
jgi:hypothetical protein